MLNSPDGKILLLSWSNHAKFPTPYSVILVLQYETSLGLTFSNFNLFNARLVHLCGFSKHFEYCNNTSRIFIFMSTRVRIDLDLALGLAAW